MTRAPAAPRCVRCGCTQSRACKVTLANGDQGCSWVLLDLRRRAGLCSACATSVELVFAHLPTRDDDQGGISAATLAGWLLMPTSTVQKALATLEERGLAEPVDKIGNEVLWCSPATDQAAAELQAEALDVADDELEPDALEPDALEQLRADAERYRALRSHLYLCSTGPSSGWYVTSDHLLEGGPRPMPSVDEYVDELLATGVRRAG